MASKTVQTADKPNPQTASKVQYHQAPKAEQKDATMVTVTRDVNERVQAQDGDFYGGWITSKVVGPFKGPPGTSSW